MESQIITFENWRYKSGTKGAKKALPLIITNSKAKKKGAHFEHLNYHLLSILIVVYHDLLSDAEILKMFPSTSSVLMEPPVISERVVEAVVEVDAYEVGRGGVGEGLLHTADSCEGRW